MPINSHSIILSYCYFLLIFVFLLLLVMFKKCKFVLLFSVHVAKLYSSYFLAVAILPSTAFYPQRLFCRELFVIGQS